MHRYEGITRMAYQFIHTQSYSPNLTKVRGTTDQFYSVAQVLGEAVRRRLFHKNAPVIHTRTAMRL